MQMICGRCLKECTIPHPWSCLNRVFFIVFLQIAYSILLLMKISQHTNILLQIILHVIELFFSLLFLLSHASSFWIFIAYDECRNNYNKQETNQKRVKLVVSIYSVSVLMTLLYVVLWDYEVLESAILYILLIIFFSAIFFCINKVTHKQQRIKFTLYLIVLLIVLYLLTTQVMMFWKDTPFQHLQRIKQQHLVFRIVSVFATYLISLLYGLGHVGFVFVFMSFKSIKRLEKAYHADYPQHRHFRIKLRKHLTITFYLFLFFASLFQLSSSFFIYKYHCFLFLLTHFIIEIFLILIISTLVVIIAAFRRREHLIHLVAWAILCFLAFLLYSFLTFL